MNYLVELEKEIRGKTFVEQVQIVKKYVIFDSPNNVGVYQIEDFYVGKSNDIIGRITHHIKEVLLVDTAKIVYNKNKLYLIESVLKSRKLKISHLDKDPKKEKQYIEDLYSKLPLINIEFVTDKMKSDRQKSVLKLLKYNKINYISDTFATKYYVCKVIIGEAIILEIAPTYELAKKRLQEYVTAKAPLKKSRKERRKMGFK